jgi:hypothetical protein
MATVTLLTLRTRVRQRANLENTAFVTDAEIDGHLNNSISELYDLIVASDPSLVAAVSNDYALSGSSVALATAAGASVYKLLGVDIKSGNGSTGYETVRKWTMSSRNNPNQRSYRVVGSTLYVYPTAAAPATYRFWYVPLLTALSGDSATTEDYNGWLEYAVLDACIKVRGKEGTDASQFMAEKEAMRRRIMDMATRDQAEPETIQDSGFGSSFPYGW